MAKYKRLDNVVYQWFTQARNKGISLSSLITMTKACETNKKLDSDPIFKASMGWLYKFKFKCLPSIRLTVKVPVPTMTVNPISTVLLKCILIQYIGIKIVIKKLLSRFEFMGKCN